MTDLDSARRANSIVVWALVLVAALSLFDLVRDYQHTQHVRWVSAAICATLLLCAAATARRGPRGAQRDRH